MAYIYITFQHIVFSIVLSHVWMYIFRFALSYLSPYLTCLLIIPVLIFILSLYYTCLHIRGDQFDVFTSITSIILSCLCIIPVSISYLSPYHTCLHILAVSIFKYSICISLFIFTCLSKVTISLSVISDTVLCSI